MDFCYCLRILAVSMLTTVKWFPHILNSSFILSFETFFQWKKPYIVSLSMPCTSSLSKKIWELDQRRRGRLETCHAHIWVRAPWTSPHPDRGCLERMKKTHLGEERGSPEGNTAASQPLNPDNREHSELLTCFSCTRIVEKLVVAVAWCSLEHVHVYCLERKGKSQTEDIWVTCLVNGTK